MISVVICSVNAEKFEAVCGQYRAAMGSEAYEVIGIHDAKSLCEGYRRGLAKSRGESVIFSHDDVEFLTPDFISRLKKHLAVYDAVGVAGTSKLIGPGWIQAGVPYVFGHIIHVVEDGSYLVEMFGTPKVVVDGIQALDGVFMAFRRPVIDAVGWDAETFTGFHLYDMDTTYRAYRAGYKLAVALDLPIVHRSGGNPEGNWDGFARAFTLKHRATLEQMSRRTFKWASVQVGNKQAMLQILADMQQLWK